MLIVRRNRHLSDFKLFYKNSCYIHIEKKLLVAMKDILKCKIIHNVG